MISDLHESIYSYVDRRNQEEPKFLDSIYKIYISNGNYGNIFVSTLLRLFNCKSSSIKYIFIGSRYKDLICELPKEQVLVIGGPKQLYFCLKNKLYFWSNGQLWKLLAKGFFDKNKSDKLVNSYQQISFFLSKFKGAVLVIENDSLPLQRLYLFAARNIGMKIICIQHGLFQKSSPAHIIDGNLADFIFVFDENSKNVFIDKGIPENKLSIMGFHSNPVKPNRMLRVGIDRKVCILGQPWGKYDVFIFNRYLQIIENICDLLRDIGIEYVYKPHPWEIKEPYLNNMDNVRICSLSEAIESYDAFISLTSTALYEVTIAGRIAIQVIDAMLDYDNFSDYGYAYSVNSNCLIDIINLIIERNALIIPNNAEPISTRFIQCINDTLNDIAICQ